MVGTAKEDKLKGTKNSDLLIGQFSKDVLFGGKGNAADVFLLSVDQLNKENADLITGFKPRHGDLIALPIDIFPKAEQTKFTAISKASLLNKFASKKHQLIYNTKNGSLYFNSNGKAQGLGEEGGLIASLKGAPKLSTKQFTYMNLIQEGAELLQGRSIIAAPSGAMLAGLILPEDGNQPTTNQLESSYQINQVRISSVLMGTADKDELIGTRSSDLIIGQSSKDILIGGKGKAADVFLLG